jgi:hypothetical protein
MINDIFNISSNLISKNCLIEALQKYARRKNYVIFEDSFGRTHNLNIWAIRNNCNIAGKFDDVLIVFWGSSNNFNIEIFECTVDPGELHLLSPINRKGTAIVKEGQYRGLWQKGFHKRDVSHPALVQRRPITIIRDFNRDNIIDLTPDNLDEYKLVQTKLGDTITRTYTHSNGSKYIEEDGIFGINLHRAHRSLLARTVGLYSAGCIVVRDYNEFTNRLLPLINKGEINYGNSFTFTLINLKDLKNEKY